MWHFAATASDEQACDDQQCKPRPVARSRLLLRRRVGQAKPRGRCDAPLASYPGATTLITSLWQRAPLFLILFPSAAFKHASSSDTGAGLMRLRPCGDSLSHHQRNQTMKGDDASNPPCPADGRPHPNTYWVLPGRFLAGEYPGAAEAEVAQAKVKQFLACGFDCFVDLTTPGELEPYVQWLPPELACGYRRHPIRDADVPDTPATMAAILDDIEAALAAGCRVYLHCWGGVGRTGTVVGCYLVRHGLDASSALRKLQQLWSTVSPSKRLRHPQVPETLAQRQFIERWAELDPRRSQEARPPGFHLDG